MTKATAHALHPFTADERRAHLRKAARIRAQRAEIKRRFSCGELSFIDIVGIAHDEKAEGHDLVCAKIRVSEIIRSKRGIGRAHCEHIMDELNIASSRCIGGLGRHQVEALAEILDA